ncbi:MAG: type II secretion system F family protein [Thermotogota bacterium]|nr:type II secretion system F family protein [Thermotogota bacterium]
MLYDFRYTGTNKKGRTVQGEIQAQSMRKAKKQIEKIANEKNINIANIEKKKLFLYTVRLPSGRKIKGRQYAYYKREVVKALEKLGYYHARIEKAIIDIRFKPPFQSILNFINLSAFMLQEGMSFDKILRLMSEEESNITLKEALRKVQNELKKGKEGPQVFYRFRDVFGEFPAKMLGLATKSGNMAQIFQATSEYMQREADYKKNLRQALLVPLFTVLAMMAAVIYYIVSIFPKTASLFLKFNLNIPPMTDTTLKLSDFFSNYWLWIFLIIFIPLLGFYFWWQTPKGKVQKDKILINLPIIGHIFHKSSIEIFFRVFAISYAASKDNIQTLRESASACRNVYIEKGVKEIAIPLMLKEGMELVPALQKAKVFNHATLSRLKSGEEAGDLLSMARQIYLFYEKEITYKMQGIIQSIQLYIGVFIFIILILLTFISAEIALVAPSTPGM